MRRLLMPSTALEQAADGKQTKEIEHVVYLLMSDIGELQKAESMEHQEQWDIRIPKTDGNAGQGNVRIRKIWTTDEDARYELTTKVRQNKDGDKIEVTVPTTEDNFQQFRFLAEKGLVKDRYHFPVIGTTLIWEVDVFKDANGRIIPWVKIDLEVPDRHTQLPELPLNFAEIIMPKGFNDMTEDVREKKIQELYDKYFNSKNQYLEKVTQNTDS